MLDERRPRVACRGVDDLRVLRRKAQREYRAPDVVQETGGEDLLGVGRTRALRDQTRGGADERGMLPQLGELEPTLVAHERVPHLHPEREAADAAEAEDHDGARDGRYLTCEAEEAAVREPQHARAERLIALHHLDEVARRRALAVDDGEDARQQHRNGRQILRVDDLRPQPRQPRRFARRHEPLRVSRVPHAMSHVRALADIRCHSTIGHRPTRLEGRGGAAHAARPPRAPRAARRDFGGRCQAGTAGRVGSARGSLAQAAGHALDFP